MRSFMDVRKIGIWTVLLWLVFSIRAFGGTLCVRPSASGAGNGSDWNNALGSNFTPVRGNIYYIASGSYGAKTWSTPNSGTVPITIKKATASDHGTDTGWSS